MKDVEQLMEHIEEFITKWEEHYGQEPYNETATIELPLRAWELLYRAAETAETRLGFLWSKKYNEDKEDNEKALEGIKKAEILYTDLCYYLINKLKDKLEIHRPRDYEYGLTYFTKKEQ